MLRFTLWIYGWMLLISLVGCDDLSMLDVPAEEAEKTFDEEAQEMIDEHDVSEARAWLADEKTHALWKGDRTKIKQFVERLYAAGAAKVYACGTKDKINEVEIVASFMAELPTDAATRARIFQVAADFWRSYLEDADPEELKEYIPIDEGQKFLDFNFDL